MPSRTRRALCSGLLVAGVVLSLVAGCGGSTAFPHRAIIAGESITSGEASGLLRQADARLPGLASASHAALSPSSRCYLAFRSSAMTYARNQLQCGPVKQFGVGKPDNWLPMSVRDTAAHRVKLLPQRNAMRPSALPGRSVLARVDGRTPAPLSSVSDPRPSAADPTLSQVIDPAPKVKLSRPAGSGLLAGPDFALRLRGTASSVTLGTGPSAVQAGSGHEFLLARFDASPSRATSISTVDSPSSSKGPTAPDAASKGAGDLTITVVADGDRRQLSGKITDTGLLVVSVPTGKQVELEVGDRGRIQDLNLRSGKRSGYAGFDPIYRSSNQQVINRSYDGATTLGSGKSKVDAELSTRFQTARLAAYDPAKGMAPSGKVWLSVALYDVTSKPSTAAAAFSSSTVELAGNDQGSAGRAPAFDSSNIVGATRMLWAVSPDFSSATMTVQGKGYVLGKLSAKDKKKKKKAPHHRFTMPQKLTLEITIGS